jgi:hypothetical protein
VTRCGAPLVGGYEERGQRGSQRRGSVLMIIEDGGAIERRDSGEPRVASRAGASGRCH